MGKKKRAAAGSNDPAATSVAVALATITHEGRKVESDAKPIHLGGHVYSIKGDNSTFTWVQKVAVPGEDIFLTYKMTAIEWSDSKSVTFEVEASEKRCPSSDDVHSWTPTASAYPHYY
jgi:hypothetical protein